MTQQEFFKEWEEKYRKSWSAFYSFLIEKDYEISYNHYKFNYFECHYGTKLTLPFEMLTGIIDKFFEKNKIEVFVIPTISKEYFYGVEIWFNRKRKIQLSIFKTRKECQRSAFLKSAEILEKELTK